MAGVITSDPSDGRNAGSSSYKHRGLVQRTPYEMGGK
jgi:hypothetical protein